MYPCFQCQAPWESSLRQPAVKETCPRCGAYLHCCMNCRFHRKGYPNECYIPDTEKIADKRRANFCDEFEFRAVPGDPQGTTATQAPVTGLWDEGPTKPNDVDGSADIKDWLLESEKSPKGFDDLFDN